MACWKRVCLSLVEAHYKCSVSALYIDFEAVCTEISAVCTEISALMPCHSTPLLMTSELILNQIPPRIKEHSSSIVVWV